MEIRQICFDGIGGLKKITNNCNSQLKYDGSMYHIHFHYGKPVALTSKRISTRTNKYSDKFNNIPKLKDVDISDKCKHKELIVACEVVAEHLKDSGLFLWEKRSNYVSSIMNMNEPGEHNLKLVAFDIVFPVMSYKERTSLLSELFPKAGEYGDNLSNNDLIYSVSNINSKDAFEDSISKGFEGVIVRNSNGESMKIKREDTCDCIIIGFTEGTGKYKKNGWIGSIEVGVFNSSKIKEIKKYNSNSLTIEEVKEYKNGILSEVGKISGFDESLRSKISKNKSKYIGKVVECSYTNWTGSKMRHPRISGNGLRTDKDIFRCDLAQLTRVPIFSN